MRVIVILHRAVDGIAGFQPRMLKLRITDPTVSKMGVRDIRMVESGLLQPASMELRIIDVSALKASAGNAANRNLAICKP